MKIIDAVSIVLVHGAQVFAIQRQTNLRAFPGYWAFPGGKVDAGDSWDGLAGIDHRLMGALRREIREELGIDLADELGRKNLTKIDYLGLAVTPDFNPQRFATHFFKITLNHAPTFTVDVGEAMQAGWYSCSGLLEMYQRGDLLAVPPVINILKALGNDISLREVKELAYTYDSEQEVPMIESLHGMRQLMPLSHTLPPANRTNSFLIGDAESPKILIDPSPKDEVEMEKFLRVVDRYGIDLVLLTHHHGDHHEFATVIARHYGVPIILSQDTFERLSKKHVGYFNDIATRILYDGDEVTTWLGHSVLVHAVPGHDEGQIALAPANLAWFLAGDLFQGVGTVVIGGEEGDMGKYMATLQKVIALKPKVIYPSHGIALGSTFILEKTLEHRYERESQILQLQQAGKTEDEILATLYTEIAPGLLPYARENIRSHTKKLKLEGKLA